MTNKAVSKAVLQVALVITLVVTANAIKPFSVGNVALHTLAAARSFSFVLPDAAVEKIEHANFLAEVYGGNIFDDDGKNSIWATNEILKSGLLATRISPTLFDGAEIKDVTPKDPARKSSPVKRAGHRVKHGRDGNDEISGSAPKTAPRMVMPPPAPAYDSLAMIQPMRLPVFNPRSVKALSLPASLSLPLSGWLAKPGNCNQVEVKAVKLIALIQQTPKLKVDLVTSQPTTISLQCRQEEKVEPEESKALIDTTIGPEEEFFFEQDAVTPFASMPAPFADLPAPSCTTLP